MFKNENRITKDKEFDNIFKNGRSSYTSDFGIKFISNNLGYNRFAVLVSTRISKKAVDRNKIKRQIKDILKNSNIKNGYDIIIITLPSILGVRYDDLKKAINSCLIRLKLKQK